MCLFEGTSGVAPARRRGWLRSHPGFLEESAAEMGCGWFRGAGLGRVVAGPSLRRWRLEGVRALQTVMRCAYKPPGASSRSGRDWTLQRRGRFPAAGSTVAAYGTFVPSGRRSMGPPNPRKWKQGVLTTGPQGRLQCCFLPRVPMAVSLGFYS